MVNTDTLIRVDAEVLTSYDSGEAVSRDTPTSPISVEGYRLPEAWESEKCSLSLSLFPSPPHPPTRTQVAYLLGLESGASGSHDVCLLRDGKDWSPDVFLEPPNPIMPKGST